MLSGNGVSMPRLRDLLRVFPFGVEHTDLLCGLRLEDEAYSVVSAIVMGTLHPRWGFVVGWISKVGMFHR